MSLDGLQWMEALLLLMPAGLCHRGWHTVSTMCQAVIKRWETKVQKLTVTLPNGLCCSGLYAEAHGANTEDVPWKITGFSEGWLRILWISFIWRISVTAKSFLLFENYLVITGAVAIKHCCFQLSSDHIIFEFSGNGLIWYNSRGNFNFTF